VEGSDVTLGTAFIAGLISFITPCVLPLVPVYLSILSGSSFDELTGKGADITPAEQKEIHMRVISNALMFILGFSILFIVGGTIAGSLGDWFNSLRAENSGAVTNWLLIVFGAVMVLLGVNMAGFWKPAFLNTEARFHLQKGKWGLLSSALIGAAFAFGWTPCIGPFLAVILAFAAGTGSKLQGGILLAAYSMGLGIPFFISALSVNLLLAFSSKMKRHFRTLELITGTILLLFGLFMLFLGITAVKNGTSSLNYIRSKLGWLDEITTEVQIGYMESVVGDDEEEGGDSGDGDEISGEIGEFDVSTGEMEDLEGPVGEIMNESGEEPVMDADGDGLPDSEQFRPSDE